MLNTSRAEGVAVPDIHSRELPSVVRMNFGLGQVVRPANHLATYILAPVSSARLAAVDSGARMDKHHRLLVHMD